MIKINILFGFALLVLARADVQDNTIISMQSEVYCEIGSIPNEYLNYTLYACANATSLPPSSTIDFSIEDMITTVKRASMVLDNPSLDVCFTYVPRHSQFKMCFNASTTNLEFQPNHEKRVFISRGIYFGNIGNQFEDDQVWPIIDPIRGYYQSNLRFTEKYSALKNEKIIITYVTSEDSDYILKLTIEEENKSSKNIHMKKWKRNNDKYLLNQDLRLSRHGQVIEYTPPKDINFRVYFYTFTRYRIQGPIKLHIEAKVTYGNPPGIDKKIWPEPSSIPGYFQNDFQRTKVYHANKGDKIFISYEVEEKPGYIIKLTVQDENEKSSKWEEYNKNYIVNKELISGQRFSAEFFAANELHYRVFFYTFIKNEIVDPSPLDYAVEIGKYPASDPNLYITEGFYRRKFEKDDSSNSNPSSILDLIF
ncbi:hypothetical protein HCN44_010612 [Aphidius gifuensis]|uniref:Odorant-binding protein n=1 Tax=Aphidius gifuensis TaxID=684658 RepID=A0A834XS46_APHGI|nr:hypothetical protein HCN44_010612 [Aphidius gifuensis]